MIDRLKTLRKSITTVQREGQAAYPTKKKKMIANVINSSANKNNAAIRQTELSVAAIACKAE